MLITIGLFSVVFLGILQLYVVYQRVMSLQDSSIGVALDGGAIVDAVRLAASQSDQIVSSHTFSGTPYSTGTATVVFELPSIDASGVVIAGSHDYIGITASGTQAYRFIDAAAGSARTSGTKLLAKSLSALLFTYDNASLSSVTSVAVDATTTSASHGKTAELHVYDHVYLKNI